MAQVGRLEKKLEACLADKEYYEAHQIYRTLFYRLSSSGKFDELFLLLESGIQRLFNVSEVGSVCDLAEVYGETLLKSSTPITPERLASIEKIFRSLPAQSVDDSTAEETTTDRRMKFITSCVKWSQNVSKREVERARGSSSLHGRLAIALWEDETFEMARAHFLLSDQPEKFGAYLAESCGHDTNAPELCITQAILQMICIRRVSFALKVLSSFTSSYPGGALSSPPFPVPLVQFCWMLLHIVPTRNISFYSALVARFQSELAKDAQYMGMLDKIGQLYFGVAPKQPGGGLLSSLLSGLIGGGGGSGNDKKLPSSDDEDDPMQGGSADSSVFSRELSLLMAADSPQIQQQDDDLD